MRILDYISGAVALFIFGVLVLQVVLMVANCVAPVPKAVQAARMEPTLAIYQAFGLNRETVRQHNQDMENQARAHFEQQARGGQ